MIANVKSREVIIVVNRIDELSDPVNQIPEIRDSIRKTLTEHDGPKDAQIIFSSAFCAKAALLGMTDAIDDKTRGAMIEWAVREQFLDLNASPTAEELLWDLSGLPQIYAAISERIVEGKDTISVCFKPDNSYAGENMRQVLEDLIADQDIERVELDDEGIDLIEDDS